MKDLSMRALLLLLALAVLVAVTGCSGKTLEAADDPTTTAVPESTATPEPQLSTPEPTPAISVELIRASWRDTESLARTHLLNGQELTCESCHGDLTEPVSEPQDQTCLDCHGGSYTVLAEETNTSTRTKHPLDHMTDTACTFCHTGHEPFRDPCSICH